MSSSENITKANNDQDIACPVCGEVHSVDSICPKCAFECHLTMTESMYERFKDIEEDRIIKHQNWWIKQQETISGLKQDLLQKNGKITAITEENNRLSAGLEFANKEVERLKSEMINDTGKGQKPVGFLISDRFVVYCIYEGLNTFGVSASSSEVKGEVCQNILFPGVKILPRHFQIEVKFSEDRKKPLFSIRKLVEDGVNIYLNTLTQNVDNNFSDITSGDSILLSQDGTNVNVELKFRKNMNR